MDTTKDSSFKIMGIDPGMVHTGWVVISGGGYVLKHGTVKTVYVEALQGQWNVATHEMYCVASREGVCRIVIEGIEGGRQLKPGRDYAPETRARLGYPLAIQAQMESLGIPTHIVGPIEARRGISRKAMHRRLLSAGPNLSPHEKDALSVAYWGLTEEKGSRAIRRRMSVIAKTVGEEASAEYNE